jgi:hypothetical protein
MRASAIVLASLLASPALAGSIDVVKSLPQGQQTDSLMQISCPTCTAVVPKVKEGAYKVATLKPGEQKLELKMVNGEEKIIRTEAWLGGSPVVFVSKATPEMIANYFPSKNAPALDGIDEASKTAAVPQSAQPLAAKAPVTAGMSDEPVAIPGQLDVSGFTLR